MRITMVAPKVYSIVIFYTKLVLTFDVNQQDLVIGENDAARVCPISEIRIHLTYISRDIINIKYDVVREKKK